MLTLISRQNDDILFALTTPWNNNMDVPIRENNSSVFLKIICHIKYIKNGVQVYVYQCLLYKI